MRCAYIRIAFPASLPPTEFHFLRIWRRLKWKPPLENSVDFKLELKFPELGDSRQPDLHAKPYFPLYVWEGGNRYRFYDMLSVSDIEWEGYVRTHSCCLGHYSYTKIFINRMKVTKEQYDDRVIEARWDFEQQAWRFMRIRDDKVDANHISVVENIIKTIIEPVHQEDVCAALSFSLSHSLPASSLRLLCTSERNSDPMTYCAAHSSRASHPNTLEGACSGASLSKPAAFPIAVSLALSPTASVPAVLPASPLQPSNSEVAFPWCTALSRGVHRRWLCKGPWTSGRGWVDPLDRLLKRLDIQTYIYCKQ